MCAYWEVTYMIYFYIVGLLLLGHDFLDAHLVPSTGSPYVWTE